MGVVDDLLADVHGRTVALQRTLDRLDRSFDAGAVAARRREEHFGRSGGGRHPAIVPAADRSPPGDHRSGSRFADRRRRLVGSNGRSRTLRPTLPPAQSLCSATPGGGRRLRAGWSRDGCVRRRPIGRRSHRHEEVIRHPRPTAGRSARPIERRRGPGRQPASTAGVETNMIRRRPIAPCPRHGAHRGGDPDGGPRHRRERRRRGPQPRLSSTTGARGPGRSNSSSDARHAAGTPREVPIRPSRSRDASPVCVRTRATRTGTPGSTSRPPVTGLREPTSSVSPTVPSTTAERTSSCRSGWRPRRTRGATGAAAPEEIPWPRGAARRCRAAPALGGVLARGRDPASNGRARRRGPRRGSTTTTAAPSQVPVGDDTQARERVERTAHERLEIARDHQDVWTLLVELPRRRRSRPSRRERAPSPPTPSRASTRRANRHRARRRAPSARGTSALQPFPAFEDRVQREGGRRHHAERERVPAPPRQLGHVHEVHAVDAGDERRARG